MTIIIPKKHKWLKIAGIITGSFVTLLILAFILIQTSSFKNFVRNKTINYLQTKLGTAVRIGKLDYHLPNSFELCDVVLIDLQKDILLSGKTISVNMNLFKLISGNIALNEIHLSGILININRKVNDSNFNYQFIVDSFANKTINNSTSKKAIQLSLDKLLLDSVAFNLNDQFHHLFYNAFVGKLYSRISKIDLDKMDFIVKDFILDNSFVSGLDKSAKNTKAIEVAASPNAESPFHLSVSSLDVHKFKLNYTNVSSRITFNNLVDTLQLKQANIYLLQESFTAGSITINNSSFSLLTNDPGVVVKDTIAKVINVAAEKGWQAKIGAIHLNNNNVSIDNNAFAPSKDGLDYNHLKLKNFSLNTNEAYYNTGTVHADVLSGTGLLNDFLVKNVKGALIYDDKKATLKDFLFSTQNSLVVADGQIVFNRLNSDQLVTLASKVNISISKSYVGYKDLLFFLPSYKKQTTLNLSPSQKILFNGKAEGTLKEININLLDIRTDDNKLQLNIKGKASNVIDTKTLGYDIVINRLYLDENILSENLKQQLREQHINLPANILLNGTVSGSMNEVNAKLKLSSPFGFSAINATAGNFRDIKNMHYNVGLTGNNLQTGKWFYQDSLLGLFTGNIKIKGTGTDYKTAAIKMIASIKSFVFKGYNYTNVDIDADLNKGEFATKASIKDNNLVTALDLNGTVDRQYPAIKGTILIDKADLEQLGFTKDSIKIRSAIFIEATDLDPKNLQAVLLLDSNVVSYNGRHLYADSISIRANTANDSTKLFVKAPFLQANMIGKYDYADLPTAFNAFIQHNFYKQSTQTLKAVDQQVVLNATVIQDSIMKEMLPGLDMNKPLIIRASFDNTKKDTSLIISASVPSVLYNSVAAENINLQVNGQDSSLRFNLTTNFMSTEGKKFYNAGVNGNFIDSVVKVTVKTEDAKHKPYYAISSVVDLRKDETKIHLSDSLLLNYAKWNVSGNNAVEIRKEGYIITNLAINKDKQSLIIDNKEPNTASPIILKMSNFNLGDVFAIANQNSIMADGILNVDATIAQPLSGLPEIVGTAGVQQFSVKKVIIGDVALKTSIGSDKVIIVKGGITGPNKLTIDGNYNTSDNTFKLSSEIQQLDLKAVEAFSQGQIKRAKGNAHGNMLLNGSTSEPRWKGELVFDSAQLATAMFGSLYKFDNQKIAFDYPTIVLNKFTITDSLNNQLVADGTIKIEPDNDFALDLQVNAKNFVAINQPRTPNALVYGIGIVDAAMVIGGTVGAPDISGKVILENKSDIHYDLPSKNNYADDLKEVVKFIDIDTIKSFNNRNTIYTSAADTAITIKYQGLKYNLNLEVKEDAGVTILIDPSSGDELKIKGKAQLNAGVDENGIVGISGVYQLTKGSYDLTYQFIKKRFELIEGSTITFSGNPMEAVADITAQYEIETSPKELLSTEVLDNGTTLGSAYNNKIPFIVVLKIKGPLTKPELSFDIKVKDNAEGVNTALSTTLDGKLAQYRNDASEMNKQVFALLILGRFISDKSSDFFATNNSNSSSTGDMVKQSVSKFLAEAVAQIAADLIKGVDINLDLKNYQADPATNAATRTDLNLALSKQLLNDRLIVTVGKSFTVEGNAPVANRQNSSNLQYLPDITTTYKLSKNGKYAIKVYRKNEYEAILDGYFTETGVAFSFTMNYEKLNELFLKEKKKSN